MANNIKQDFFDSIGKELLGKFRRINHLTTKATGEIGDYHEEILKEVLKNFLSRRYSIKTGYMYFDSDNVSKQIDIMIIDENNPFTYLFQSGDFAIVRPHAVTCAIEVKTELNQNEFEKAFMNLSEAIRIKFLSKTGGLMSFIFGYDSVNPTNETLDKWFKLPTIGSTRNNEELWPSQILFLNKAQLLWAYNKKDSKGKKLDRYYYRLFQDKTKDDKFDDRAFHLSIFTSAILASISNNEINSGKMTNFNSGDIVDFTKSMISFDRFRPEEGHTFSGT